MKEPLPPEGVILPAPEVIFAPNDYVALPGQDPSPKPAARFDPGGRRTEMTWKGREIYVQHGWPFDPATWKRIKI